MNWDISIGHCKQVSGRLLQWVGQRSASRRMVLDGEAMEYAGRLQMRYGVLKHQAQWGQTGMQPVRASLSMGTDGGEPTSLEKNLMA